MPYPVRPGETFNASTTPIESGLVGTIGVRITDGETPPTTVVARTTSGISEQVPGSGIYSVTLTAPTSAGQYLIVWDTGGDNPVYSDDDLTVTSTAPNLPSIEDGGIVPFREEIAALVRPRNRDASGRVVQDWTDNTQPTRDEIDLYIRLAVDEVTDIIGADPTDATIIHSGRGAAALIAARMVEEASDDPRDEILKYWERRITTRLAKLAENAAEAGAGGDPSDTDDALLPQYSFPDPAEVGWDTVPGAETPYVPRA